MRFQHKLGPLKVLNQHIVAYPTPMNLSYAYNFGSLAGFVLASQIVTGILLAMHYVGHVDLAFNSVVHLMNDVPSGMIIRYAHANGASLFFTVVYLHILRGIYYSSGNQPREMVWITGVVILLVMVITAFIGYVLPWGQMSFWGATVITSLATVLPVIGKTVVSWLWGGFSIDNPTLNRFYSLHYTLPFVLAGLSIFHIAALHQYGSTNPLGVNTQTSTIPFSVYFASKDLLGLLFLLFAFAYLVFFYPEVLGLLQRMAFYCYNAVMYINAICWNCVSSIRYNNSAIINDYSYTTLACIIYISDISYSYNMSYKDSDKFKTSLKSASNCIYSTGTLETTRVNTDIKTEKSHIDSDNFNYWLAGLVDGDGSLLINANGSYSFELTLDSKDLHTLHYIQSVLGYGRIAKRSSADAYRIRTYVQEDVIDIIHRLNGKLLTRGKHVQLTNLCACLSITPIIPNDIETSRYQAEFIQKVMEFKRRNDNNV